MIERLVDSLPASALLTLGLGILPGVSLLSGALLALIELVRGPLQAFLVGAVAAALLAVLGLLTNHNPLAALIQPLGGPLLGIWIPVLLLAFVLRRSRSLSLTLTVASLVGCLVVVGQMLLMAQPIEFWKHLLGQALAQLQVMHGAKAKYWQEAVVHMARLMPGVSAAGGVFGVMVMVMLGRYAQARLVRPGAFGEEFRRLSLGYSVTIIASLLLVVRLAYPNLMLQNVAIVILAMFAFQGLAVIHALFKTRAWPGYGLVILYVLIVLFPLWLLGLVSAAGLVDNWFDFRNLRQKAPKT